MDRRWWMGLWRRWKWRRVHPWKCAPYCNQRPCRRAHSDDSGADAASHLQPGDGYRDQHGHAAAQRPAGEVCHARDVQLHAQKPEQAAQLAVVSYSHLFHMFEPHAPTMDVWMMGPGNLKQLITEWYEVHPAFAGLKASA